MSANRNSTDTSGAGLAHGSSTGAPGIPTGVQDQRAQYDPTTTGVNPATGAAYSKSTSEHHDVPATKQTGEQDKNKAIHQSVGEKGSDIGRKAQGVMASVHGAGESLRGALTSAVDRAFGSEESAEWNEEIARRGEQEIRSGELGGSSNSSK